MTEQKGWSPYSVDEFINDYVNGMTNDELSSKYKGSTDQIKRFIKKLRQQRDLPDRKGLSASFSYNANNVKNSFVSFLQKAKTLKEIKKKFGDELAESLLEEDYEGYNLFVQIDDYGDECYILLPEPRDEIQVKKREWSFYNSFIEEEGAAPIRQAYHLVKLPDKLFSYHEDKRVDIIPLYDIHYGHYGHKYNKFIAYVEYIKNTPNVLTFLGGDLLENALDDGRGMCYEQEKPPQTQLSELVRILAPIAHKCLFIMPGNHEWRTYKRSGIDPSYFIAKKLDIPYFDGPVYCSIVGAGHKWKMYAFHGRSASQTKGGKLNSAGRPRRFTDFVNWYVSGHVHEPVLDNETCIVEDPVNCRLVYKTQWTVVCPSFLRYEGTYAYRSGYPPPGKGGVKLSMYANGDYIAKLTEH